jgi:hypothetical protein
MELFTCDICGEVISAKGKPKPRPTYRVTVNIPVPKGKKWRNPATGVLDDKKFITERINLYPKDGNHICLKCLKLPLLKGLAKLFKEDK